MVYKPWEINNILCKHASESSFVRRNKNSPELLNEAISFDIETTNTYSQNGDKIAFMYCWMLDIYDCCIMGRTWTEFLYVVDEIVKHFNLGCNRKHIIIYVHNLPFEFQFIRKYFEWDNVFASKRRQPLFAITKNGIEFRCSYKLSGYRLEKVGEHLRNKIEKLVGKLDYSKIRISTPTYQTPLTEDEIAYCVNDVKIVSEFIREKIADEKGIHHIPLTKTGYVRRMCRRNLYRGDSRKKFPRLINSLTLAVDEYKVAKKANAGGFTHASLWSSGNTVDDVASYDFISSYAAVMVAEKYPMSRGFEITSDITKKRFDELRNKYLCIFEVELRNIEPKCKYESYIPEAKCTVCENAKVFNGRVYSADRVVIAITSIDYEIIERCYTFDITRFIHFYVYRQDYLPTEFVRTVLDLYSEKTKLKNVVGKEEEYSWAKENLCSCFGMAITSVVHDKNEYNSGWVENNNKLSDEEIEEQLKIENNKKGKFLSYLWGVFITAYARRNLWDAIIALGPDYQYSDTDCVKLTNAERHEDYFRSYNKVITEKLETALQHHDIDVSMIRPKTIDDKEKVLGTWDLDGFYSEFKTLGAKRYMTKDNDGNYELHVSGLSSEKAMDYILTKTDKPFDFFVDDMSVPANYTGKVLHTVIDEPFCETVTDYKGNSALVSEKTFVHLEPTDYSLSFARAINDFVTRKNDFAHK